MSKKSDNRRRAARLKKLQKRAAGPHEFAWADTLGAEMSALDAEIAGISRRLLAAIHKNMACKIEAELLRLFL